jgi:hypothetical protein
MRINIIIASFNSEGLCSSCMSHLLLKIYSGLTDIDCSWIYQLSGHLAFRSFVIICLLTRKDELLPAT